MSSSEDVVLTSAVGRFPLEDVLADEIEHPEDGMKKWDTRFLELAEHVSTWSKDPSTKVGAVVVNDDRIVLGMGYNGFARGVKDWTDRYDDRSTKYKLIVHAELNAILAAGKAAQGATIYVTPSFGLPPLCSNCCKAVIQAGIKRVVGWQPNVSDEVAARWAEEIEASYMMCEEAGVQMSVVAKDKKARYPSNVKP